MKLATIVLALCLAAMGCGDDTEADRQGAECGTNADCFEEGQVCLTQFKGGYCGAVGCSGNEGCSNGSACVLHDDGSNYCFRTCLNKPDCNANRTLDNEANCVSSITYVDPMTSGKACEPPSGS